MGRKYDLINGNIIGYVDAYGAVFSEFTGENLEFHSDYFPGQTRRLWRWNNDKSIHWFTSENRLDAEQLESVRTHLSKKYGITWWKNGFHDIQHLRSISK